MGYSTEVVIRARERLAQAKADRESENQAHLAIAYDKVPRIREIDRQLRRTMAQAAQTVFTQGGDVAEAMSRAREENLGLQREREALVRANFEEGFLDEAPLCDRCGGTGYVGSAMCECLRELCRQEQKKELTFLSGSWESFSQFRLDYYSDRYDAKYGASPRAIMERNLKNCREYALSFGPYSGNLLFIGNTGLGKTFLSACIARVVAERGNSVVYESADSLFEKLERDKFHPSEESQREAEKLKTCDLLILDDLGTEMTGQFVISALYSLVNARLLNNRPMLISTNLIVDEIARRYSPQIASRLDGCFNRLTFVGEDIRVKKNRGY